MVDEHDYPADSNAEAAADATASTPRPQWEREDTGKQPPSPPLRTEGRERPGSSRRCRMTGLRPGTAYTACVAARQNHDVGITNVSKVPCFPPSPPP